MKRIVYTLVILTLFVLPAAAQPNPEAETPDSLFWDMLELVPGTVIALQQPLPLGYANYHAAAVRRSAHTQPASFAAFEALDDDTRSIWSAGFRRVSAGPSNIPLMLGQAGGEMADAVGFDFFDITAGIEYGEPPGTMTIFAGTFDTEAVAETFTAHDYARQDDIGDAVLWRRADGERDQAVDSQNVQLGNPFGGRLGRKQPVAVIPGSGETVYIASSGVWAEVQLLAQVSQGNAPAFLDMGEYRTLAEAITDSTVYTGTLVQAQFVNPLHMSEASADYTELTQDMAEMMPTFRGVAPEWCDYSPLLPYSLAALADRQEGEDQVALVALVYYNEDDARTAAEELSRRLAVFTAALDQKQHDFPILDDVEGAVVEPPQVYTSETTGMSAAVAAVRYPLPSDEVDPEVRLHVASGQVFRYWVASLYNRSFYPLWQLTLADWMVEEFCQE